MPERSLASAGGGEAGWALIEVIVAASVLVIVVLGVLSALDTTARSAGNNRQRTISSALAEQDLERMRGLTAVDLSNYRWTRTATMQTSANPVSTTAYEVTSRADWIRDDTSTVENCTDKSQGSYLKISSTVQPIPNTSVPAATLSSLMAPPTGFGANQGTLSVQVKSSTGQPLVGVPVSVSGPDNLNDTTNQVGCAVFGYIDAGTYAVKVTSPNLVDKGGVAGGATRADVTAGNVSTISLDLDQAASLTVKVDTKVGNVVQADNSEGIVAANTGVPPSGFRQFTPTAPSSSVLLTGLYPFASPGYTVFSGGCTDADPSKYDPNYFTTYPQGVVTLAPGASGGTITVREPAVNLTVTSNGTVYRKARVVLTVKDGTCNGRKSTFNANYANTDPQRLTATGGLPSPGPGLPFGRYSLCVDDRLNYAVANVDNTSPDGSTVAVDIKTSVTGGLGTCP